MAASLHGLAHSMGLKNQRPSPKLKLRDVEEVLRGIAPALAPTPSEKPCDTDKIPGREHITIPDMFASFYSLPPQINKHCEPIKKESDTFIRECVPTTQLSLGL